MKTILKTLVGLCVMAMVCAMGCTKPNNDDNDNNSNNNNGNSGGGNSGPDVTVTTYTPSDITSSTAVCGGFVQVAQGLSLTKVGVCWSTSPNPTANDSQLSSEAWNEPFIRTVSGLSPNTTYHVRAFALRGLEYYYGEDKYFTTLSDGGGGGGGGGTMPTLPSVYTLYVDVVTSNSVQGGGNVTNDGGATVTERGLCWSVSSNPTINDNHMSSGGGTGEFWLSITGLTANTTYHVKAYATNSVGTSYGNEVLFTTTSSVSWPDGVLPGVFSVSATKKVHFSQGNLQFIGSAATPYWKFADNQWEFLGEGQSDDSRYIDRDLFFWGSSNYNHGAVCYHPWSKPEGHDCRAYGIETCNLYDKTGKADWGYNAISNGGNQENMGWRTLTYLEWSYILNDRITNSGLRYVTAQVNGINGLIILPDDWISSYCVLNNANNNVVSFDSNVIPVKEWRERLESHGAVFLPAAGVRHGASHVYNEEGLYWSSSFRRSTTYLDAAYSICFVSNFYVEIQHTHNRFHGLSVRLVKDYQ
jgi:hypothetical protein